MTTAELFTQIITGIDTHMAQYKLQTQEDYVRYEIINRIRVMIEQGKSFPNCTTAQMEELVPMLEAKYFPKQAPIAVPQPPPAAPVATVTIDTETKPNGHLSSYVAVGSFQDGTWVRKGYPKQFDRLTVQQSYTGRNNSTRIAWQISVPVNFKLHIARVHNGSAQTQSDVEVLFTPAPAPQPQPTQKPTPKAKAPKLTTAQRARKAMLLKALAVHFADPGRVAGWKYCSMAWIEATYAACQMSDPDTDYLNYMFIDCGFSAEEKATWGIVPARRPAA